MQITGTLKRINETKQVTSTFKNRTFDIEKNDEKYPQILRLELKQDGCDIIDAYGIGQEIVCDINLLGREWQKTPDDDVVVFNTISAWKIQPVKRENQSASQTQSNPQEYKGKVELTQNLGGALPNDEEHDDLPF
jgi:hypothetical protein